MPTLRSRRKTAIKFVTPSGVVAVVAKEASTELLAALRRKLERKLRKSGHPSAQGAKQLIEFGPGGLLPVLKSPC